MCDLNEYCRLSRKRHHLDHNADELHNQRRMRNEGNYRVITDSLWESRETVLKGENIPLNSIHVDVTQMKALSGAPGGTCDLFKRIYSASSLASHHPLKEWTNHIDSEGRATLALLKWCAHHSKPDTRGVVHLVEAGADVCFMGASMNLPVLHHFVAKGWADCVAACFRTKRPIDFSKGYSHGWTLLHLICNTVGDPRTNEAVLALVVDRLQTHPTDVVEWGAEDIDGNDFLSCAALHRKFSLFWPLVAPMCCFSDLMIIHLKQEIEASDFDALHEKYKKSTVFKSRSTVADVV